jgi:DNA-binding SARP family transcriptional activator
VIVEEGGHTTVTRRSHDEPSPSLQLCVFGRTKVVGSVGTIEFTRAKERSLLAALALFHDRVVSSDRLVQALWEDQPPRRPQRALHTHIQRVRAALGPAVIETHPDGYSLATEVTVDAESLEREARTADSPTTLRAALELEGRSLRRLRRVGAR